MRELVQHPSKLNYFSGIMRKLDGFVKNDMYSPDVSSFGSHCGMERENYIAVNLQGDIITCMNTNVDSVALTGKTHKLGNISNLEGARLDTIKHWSERDKCSKCPVMPVCRGACMFQDGKNFGTTCEHEYSDLVPLLATAIYNKTGIMPYYIKPLEHDIPESRKDIFGMVGTAQQDASSRKVIPIKPI
jgi:uncharacterized protein